MAKTPDDEPRRDASTAKKDPQDWKTGDEPMTPAQRSYLETLAAEDEESIDEEMTKAQASERIEALRQEGGRTGGRERGRRPLAEQVDEHDLRARIADSLEHIADSLVKIEAILRQSAQRQPRHGEEFRPRRREEERRGGYGGGGYRRDDDRERGGPPRGGGGRPGRPWRRDRFSG